MQPSSAMPRTPAKAIAVIAGASDTMTASRSMLPLERSAKSPLFDRASISAFDPQRTSAGLPVCISGADS